MNINQRLHLQHFFEQVITRSGYFLAVASLLTTALLLTHSRAGVFCTLTAIILLMTALNFKIHRRNHSILIITFLLIIYGGIIFYFSHHDLWLRLEQHGFTDNSRDQVRQLVIEAILTRPFLGFGYGSFESVFPLFQTLEISGDFNTPLLWNYAHNSYLELAFELGIPATLGLIYCLLKLVKLCFLGLYCRKRNWIYPAIGLSASSLACLHASVDFSLQIPAVAYTYAMIIGIACAQSFSTQSL